MSVGVPSSSVIARRLPRPSFNRRRPSSSGRRFPDVEQGSVLDPLLFLVYINDIKNACPDTNIKLFADDANFLLKETVNLN